MKNVAFIPVRGGSTSIPFKNIKPMCGKPLVYWTAMAASRAKCVETVYVATDSGVIRDAVTALNIPKVSVIGRSPETATNTASSESALLEFAERYEFDNVVFIQATSPLLTEEDIDEAFALLRDPECDSVLSAVLDKRFYWKQLDDGSAKELNYDVYARPRRQDFEGCYQENGALYITSRSSLLKTRNRVSGRIKLHIMPQDTAFEIDEPEDWLIVEQLLKKRLLKLAPPAKIRLFLTDCDGCLTDGGMYYSESGDEAKKFNTKDGMGLGLLREKGIKTGIVTSEVSEAVKRRCKKLKLDYLELGCKDKLAAIKTICADEGISLCEVAYVGDDLNDLEALDSVGLSFAPADAVKAVRDRVDVVTCASGGYGVIREAAVFVIDRL